MNSPAVALWLSLGLLAYTFIFYPLLLAVAARFRSRPVNRGKRHPRSVSIILAVHNEEDRILDRLGELLELLTESGMDGEIIVVSDGSTDATAELARSFFSEAVQVVELPHRVGKALALTAGWALARNEILVFADARQTWETQALRFLLENFADPDVGAVSGDLVLRSKPGVMTGVSIYWGFEKWLRRQESMASSMVGATGAISAVRRGLFRPIPPGTILDDVYWPLQVVMQGFRVVHDERAQAFDHLPDRPADEFRRKVRTLAGNLQLVMRLPAAVIPWVNPVWLQFVSHKLLRLVSPWALMVLLVTSALLAHPFYRFMFWGQLVCYGLALAGLAGGTRIRNRLVSAASSFLVLNAAAFAAFWVWITGQAGRSWTKVAYVQTTVGKRRPATVEIPEAEHADSLF